MAPLNTNTARVVDPVLSGIAQGYRHAQRVGNVLFPPINVGQRGGRVIEFGRESFFNYKARRAPGANAKMIQFGYEGKPYLLEQYSLDVPIPREHSEEAQAVPGIDLGKRAVNVAMDTLTLTLEIEQAELATNPANYDANHKVSFADGAGWGNHADSNPIDDVLSAKDAVRRSCGMEPNRMVIGARPYLSLQRHPTIVERFKYTTADSITPKMLAGLFDLEEVVVGKASYIEEKDENLFKDAWGNAAVLAYTPTQDAALEQPSFGYTYTLKGHPFVEPPRWEGSQRSWVYGVTYERAPVLTGITSGFLFQNLV